MRFSRQNGLQRNQDRRGSCRRNEGGRRDLYNQRGSTFREDRNLRRVSNTRRDPEPRRGSDLSRAPHRVQTNYRGFVQNRPHYRNNQSSNTQQRGVKSARYEVGSLLIVSGKLVKATINTGAQETRLGLGVFRWIKGRQNVVQRKKVVRSLGGIELAEVVTVAMGVRETTKEEIECILDNRVPSNEISLGLRALVRLGIQVRVGDEDCRILRVTHQEPNKERRRSTQFSNLTYLRDDRVRRYDFLDQGESRRINEWQ